MDGEKKLLIIAPSQISRPAAMSLLLLRFGELWLKSFEVRRRFTDRLITNILEGLGVQKIHVRIIKSHDRIFIEVLKKDAKKASALLSKTFGLVSFSQVEEIESDREKIKEKVLEIASKILAPKNTFAMRVKRTGTHAFGSQELERELGGAVIEKFGNKVNLTKPDKTISVELRDNRAYLFFEKTDSLGGLPLGVEGKVAVLFSGYYKKSIVASFLMMKRGCKVFPMFVKSKAEKKEKGAIAILSKYDPLAKPIFIKSEKSAFKAAWKAHARALVVSDTLAKTLKKKTRRFDKKTGVFALEPLVGYTKEDIAKIYKKILTCS